MIRDRLLLACALSLCVPRLASAQDSSALAGSYRVASDQTTVQIPEWGEDCGPRPASHTGASGRTVTVNADGPQLVVQDGRRHNRTDGCWSDNPAVHRISAGGGNGHWTVVCSTASTDYQHESGTYSISADATHFTVRDSTEYSWQLRNSRCHATASRTISYERNGPPPEVAAPVVDAGPARPVATPPVNRCATPGAAVRLAISPTRRSLAPGGRACFRARVLDANQCELPAASAPQVSWTLARSGGTATAADATMENGCVRAPSASPVGEYAVTATGGGFTDHAVAAIVSEDELRSLVAQHIEDEDAGVIAIPVGQSSGTGIGTAVVHESAPPRGEGEDHRRLLAVLVGVALALGVAGALLLRRGRATPNATEAHAPEESRDSSPGSRARKSVVPITARELADTAMSAVERIASEARTVERPIERPLVKRCPTCRTRFTEEIAFCPEHGIALVRDESPRSIAPPSLEPAAAPRLCPTCGQPVDATAEFCPHDATPLGGAPTPKVCPVCGHRYADTVAFCGNDGTTLVRG